MSSFDPKQGIAAFRRQLAEADRDRRQAQDDHVSAEEENDRLRAELTSAQGALECMTADRDSFVAERDQLRAELALCKTDRDREERCHIKQAEDNVALRAELAEAKCFAEALEGDLAIAHQTNDTLQSELAAVKAERETLLRFRNDQTEEAMSQLAAARAEVKDTREYFAESLRELKGLIRELVEALEVSNRVINMYEADYGELGVAYDTELIARAKGVLS